MQYHRLSTTDAVADGEMMRVDIGDHQLAVANVGGEYFAFSDRCPHMNVSLSRGRLKAKTLVCPLHRASFDITSGEKLSDPKIPAPRMIKMVDLMAEIETKNLPVYPLKEEDGQLFVGLPE